MRPTRLALHGFGAFRDPTDVDFTDIELLALVGDTGSGKSTIIDAITFALYGSIARYDDKKAVAPVINQTSTRARVRLDFELGGRTYTAARLVLRTKNGATTKEARLERGDEILAADAKSMTATVEQLLGLDVDQFNRTVVLPQGRFADFLHDRPAERQATLRQLLGLEIYSRMGKEARRRAVEARNQITALQPDLDAGADLTDQRRTELVAHADTATSARARFTTDCYELAAVQAELTRQQADLAELERRLTLLEGIVVPDHLDELETRRAAAIEAEQTAGDALTEAGDARRAAARASAEGPDLAQCREQRVLREDADRLATELQQADDHRSTTAGAQRAAQRAADAVVARQQRLDDAATLAVTSEAEARAAVDDGPNHAQVVAWIAARRRRDAVATELTARRGEVAASEAELVPLTAAAAQAETAWAEAQHALDHARQRAGAAGFIGTLAVGQPCPLCLQEVDALPMHAADDGVDAADRQLAAATAARTRADGDVGDARRRRDATAAELAGTASTLRSLDEDLDGVGDLAELDRRREDAEQRAERLRVAAAERQAAQAAATGHRTAPEHRAVLDAAAAARDTANSAATTAADLRRRVDAAQGRLADVPELARLEELIAEATRLATAARQATTAEEHADRAATNASASVHAITAELQAAARELTATRDRVAALDPPSIAAEQVVVTWQAIAAWAADRRTKDREARARLRVAADATRTRSSTLDADARQRCADALAEPGLDLIGLEPTAVRELLANREARRLGAVEAFDHDRQRLAGVRSRVATLTETAQVAEKTGHLLRVDGFESWLMQAALEALVDSASVRMRELSGGQFSLQLDDRDFAVRDHSNADELRSARTLSGGETFLASLSLALALAEATAELAPEGAPAIESIFLDEGFGTLDPTTLDTVAAAIEELGARGRMVGIVTHIRELAERMPVRLDVTKSSGTSTVVRVEV